MHKHLILNIPNKTIPPGGGFRSFNGLTDRIDWNSVWNPTGLPITIGVWIYRTATTGIRYIFNIQNTANTSYGIIFNLDLSQPCAIFSRLGATPLKRVGDTGTSPTVSKWEYWLVTHDGTFTAYNTIHIYRNGTEIVYNDASAANGVTESAVAGKWCLGGRTYDDTRNWGGKLGEVSVWNRVLSSTEIALLSSFKSPKSGLSVSSGLTFCVRMINPVDVVTGQSGTLDGTTL